IIPVPFDPRIIEHVPPAVAKAAMDTGVARKPIEDMDAYRQSLRSRRDPVAGVLQLVFQRLKRSPKRVVFAEGEEEQVIRAAATFVQEGLGTALLVGREEPIRQSAKNLGIELGKGIQIINAALSKRNANYVAYLYERLQRQGYLVRDVQRLINQDRNHFAACVVALNPEAAAAYPFNRLTGPANVLIMPAFHSASISTKMLQELGGATVIGPMLVGLDRPVQIVPLGAKDSQLVNMAALAAFNVSG